MRTTTALRRMLHQPGIIVAPASLLNDMVSVQDFFEIMGLQETLDLADTWSQRTTMSP